jgi:hypothetical protein
LINQFNCLWTGRVFATCDIHTRLVLSMAYGWRGQGLNLRDSHGVHATRLPGRVYVLALILPRRSSHKIHGKTTNTWYIANTIVLLLTYHHFLKVNSLKCQRTISQHHHSSRTWRKCGERNASPTSRRRARRKKGAESLVTSR